MQADDTFIVKKHLNFDNGNIPCGSIIKILSLNKNKNKYLISITPYTKNGIRTSKTFTVNKEFILEYGEK